MIKIKEPVELNEITTHKKDVPDSLFVCWGSPEIRCKGSIQRLSKEYKANKIFILKYTNHACKERERNIKEMKKKLNNVGEINEIIINENAALPVLKDIARQIEISTKKNNAKVTMDISTPIKWHLLFLLKLLDTRKLLNRFRFLYTEPKEYLTNLFQPLSFGIKEIFPIPLYHGNYDFSKEDLLVLILGYEGKRAMALYDNIDPTEVLLIIADPPYHPKWKGRTEKMNKEIINMVGPNKIEYMDSRNPISIALKLNRILSNRKYSKYNLFISPLGTKPQIIGLFLYLSTFSVNPILMYGAPLRHNKLFYSHGIGRTWKLPFDRLKEDEKGNKVF